MTECVNEGYRRIAKETEQNKTERKERKRKKEKRRKKEIERNGSR